MTRQPHLVSALALLLGAAGSATAQQHVWSRAFGNSNAADEAIGNAVVADRHGGVVMGGSMQGQVHFGLGLMQARGGPDGLVGRFSSADGSTQWLVQIGGPGAFTTVNGVAVDAAGDVYAVGSFSSSVTLPGAALTSAGGTDGFVLKLAGANGAPRWFVRFGGPSPDEAYAVTIDGNGEVVVTGFFNGSVEGLTSAGASDIFLGRYSGADGRLIRAQRFGGPGPDSGTGLATGQDGIVLAGTFSGVVDFGGGAVKSAGGTDMFLASYDRRGAHRWSRTAGGAGEDVANAVATDAAGHPVVTGYVVGTVDFGGGSRVGTTVPAIFVAQYAADGAHRWSRTFRSPTLPLFGGAGRALAIKPDGRVVLTGSIVDDVDFGGGALSGPYTADIFIAQFSASGLHDWSSRFPGSFRDEGQGVAVDQGEITVVGVFGRAVDLGGGWLSPGGSNNAFLAEFGITCDVTQDGTIGALDAGWVLQAVVGLRVLTPGQFAAADATGDGSLSALDGTRILQWSAGLRPPDVPATLCGQ